MTGFYFYFLVSPRRNSSRPLAKLLWNSTLRRWKIKSFIQSHVSKMLLSTGYSSSIMVDRDF
jgi:hypothetical protein